MFYNSPRVELQLLRKRKTRRYFTYRKASSPPVKKMEYTQKLDFFNIYYRSENLRIRIDTNLFLLLMSKDKK